ncbi:uncharacterized protein PAC_17167 [Phialocephala subalpina]|uniref:Amino acid transporter transmembrane domain-containing protein n=1 Tax=Phialocephala subalpina TaxID=576137 RepID=A0A1L7XQN5_9HELO|nr:uncharacterized protein PAC_17167 [Phialocephala subalpina]
MAAQEIGFYGGMALLISSITGPGLTTIPLLYQQAGWLTPTIAFVLFGALAGVVSLFLVETMSAIHGNERFQARVEFSTVAHLYLGDRIHILMQVLLFCALQSINVSSIIISEQTMDSLLIRLFHKTCALSFTHGWVCVSEISPSGSPFDSYVLFSLGYIIAAAMVLPLSMMSLVQNIKFQLISVAALFFVMIVWIFLFADHGLDREIPTVGNNQSALFGFVLSNFAFITTVPSFINELSRRVSIHKSIVYPIIICVALYIVIGLTGAASFQIKSTSDILATLSTADQNKILIILVNIVFPISVLVTIVIRYNLVRGNICSNKWATVWASLVPWAIIIPFQTKGWLVLVMNWSSLIFGSSTNFIIPLVLYLSSKTHTASTVDTSGGDIFVLHRENSTASARSAPGSFASVRRSLALEGVPHLITTPADEENSVTIYEPSAPPPVVATSPVANRRNSTSYQETSSKKSDKGNDIADMSQDTSASGLDPSSIPLRVVYSPTVSRNPSIGRRSHDGRPSNVSNSEATGESTEEVLLPTQILPTAQSLEAPALSEGQVLRRRSSTATRNNSSTSHRPLSAAEGLSFQERAQEDITTHTVFKAFTKRKWLRGTLIAKASLAIVTCCVLGNLIYT